MNGYKVLHDYIQHRFYEIKSSTDWGVFNVLDYLCRSRTDEKSSSVLSALNILMSTAVLYMICNMTSDKRFTENAINMLMIFNMNDR